MWIDSSTSDPPEAVRRHSTQCRWVETKTRRRWWRQLQGSTTERRWCRQWRHVGNTCRLTVSIILCNNNCEVLVTRLTCNNSRNDLAFTRTTRLFDNMTSPFRFNHSLHCDTCYFHQCSTNQQPASRSHDDEAGESCRQCQCSTTQVQRSVTPFLVFICHNQIEQVTTLFTVFEERFCKARYRHFQNLRNKKVKFKI